MELKPAKRCVTPLGIQWSADETVIDPRSGCVWRICVQVTTLDPDPELFVRVTGAHNCAVVDLITAEGAVWARRIQSFETPARWDEEDSRIEQYAAEREKLARAIHRRVNSSRQGGTVPYLVGDAQRAVAAVIEQGWIPPEGYIDEN